MQPISMAFDVKAIDSASGSIVIDMTDNISGDNEVFGFDNGQKSAFQAGSLQPDKSYISSVRSYPTNIEVTTVKTYAS